MFHMLIFFLYHPFALIHNELPELACNTSVWFLQKVALLHIGEQFKPDAIFRLLHIFTYCRRR
jgi:hypothetical protein